MESLLVDAGGAGVQVRAHLSAIATDHGAFVLVGVVDLSPQRQGPELASAATHDPLTGLLNRTGLLAQLNALLTQERSASVALLGLDDLAPVHDTYGPAVGDQLLLQVATVLAEISAPDGLACRLAGDEFVVVADTTDEVALGRFLTEELSRVEVRVSPGLVLMPAASVGTAAVRPGMTVSQILTQADDSMYADKRRRQAALAALVAPSAPSAPFEG